MGQKSSQIAREDFNDSPIQEPEEDLYGVNTFALTLAKRIANLKGTEGSTLALNGPWGSGKSSIVNLIRFHLNPYIKNNELLVVTFTSWWFRGEEALTMAFLQELEAVCRKTLGHRAKDVFKKARKRLIAREAVADWIKTAGEQDWKKATAQFASRYFSDAQTIEDIFERLKSLLKEQNKRILVILDDLDRLTPAEQIQMFRLVKSVGRLPRILYLLVFDREIAEREVGRAFPSEGSHFLEKIIQANFDIPPPERDVLNDVLYKRIVEICGDHSDVDHNYFFNSFHGSVAPYITSPRHVVRLSNAMAITFPPIKGEVNVADYLAIETMRLFEPKLYDLVRRERGRLCGASENGDHNEGRIRPFLEATSTERREIAEESLKRLFPKLQNIGYGHDFLAQWEANRQICAEKYFDTYFRLQVGEQVLSRSELDQFIEKLADAQAVKRTLLNAAHTRRRNGRSAAPVWLDEINTHARKIDRTLVKPLLSAVFEVADDLIAADERDPRVEYFDNRVRIHWLMWRLVGEQFSLPERSNLLVDCANKASVAWLVHLATRAWQDYFPRGKESPTPLERCLVERDKIDRLRDLALTRIRESAVTGALIGHSQLGWLLFRWVEMANDDGDEAKAWVSNQLNTIEGLAAMAAAFTNKKFSQSLPMFDSVIDHVGEMTTFVELSSIQRFVNPDEFRSRLTEALGHKDLTEIQAGRIRGALEAWAHTESSRYND